MIAGDQYARRGIVQTDQATRVSRRKHDAPHIAAQRKYITILQRNKVIGRNGRGELHQLSHPFDHFVGVLPRHAAAREHAVVKVISPFPLPVEIGEPPAIERVRQHLRAGLGNDLRRQPKMIDVRVGDDDAANVFERQTALTQRFAQRGKCRRLFGSRVDQRQFIAFGEIDVDGADGKRCWNCDGLQVVENRRPLYPPSNLGKKLVITNSTVRAIRITTVTHDRIFMTRPLMNLPINRLSLISTSIATRMMGSSTPFSV